jgi:dTDP-4-dehydrorhamnose reductase
MVPFCQSYFETAEYNGESLNVKKVNGVSTSSYVTPAKRPLNSRLCNRKFEQVFNVSLPDWKTGVVRVVKETLGK